MNPSVDMIYDMKRKMLAKYPRFGSEIATANIEFRDDLQYRTAATDGKNIYFDPEYFMSLSENERVFTIAHEIMHIKFMHIYRLADKDGKKRDQKLWNIATDAVINANLERDGFTIKEGYVNMPEALNYSAEEFYEILLKEKEEKEKQQQNKQGNQGGSREQSDNSEDKDSSQNDMSNQGDDHSLWEEAFNKQQQQEKKQKSSNQSEEQNEQENQGDSEEQNENSKDKDGSQKQQSNVTRQKTITQRQLEFDEKREFEDNRKEKRERFKARREKTQQYIRETQESVIEELGSIGESKEVIDWKVLLRREVEKTETIWSQRRSIAENNYAYRLEENDIEDDAESEIMIDVSGSVELDLIKAFLRQTKSLLGQSQLRVGCFATRFSGFMDIKSTKDIENFIIPQGCGMGTDLDLPVRSFSKKKEINKIIFTDGYSYDMPKEDLKRENVIWLVYGNRDFKPCCGKVINITERQLEQLHLVSRDISREDEGR